MKRRTTGCYIDRGAIDFSEVGPVDTPTSGWVEMHLARAVRAWFFAGLAGAVVIAAFGVFQ